MINQSKILRLLTVIGAKIKELLQNKKVTQNEWLKGISDIFNKYEGARVPAIRE